MLTNPMPSPMPEPRFPRQEPRSNPIGAPIRRAPMMPTGMPMFHKGTSFVPETGPAMLEKGEAVIPKEKNMESVRDILAGAGHEPKPAKVIKSIHTRKVHGHQGHVSYIHEHHHTRPEHHPMEEHASANQDEMVNHMMEHMGQPNPGEQEANEGQSGVPGAMPGA